MVQLEFDNARQGTSFPRRSKREFSKDSELVR